MAMKIFSNDFEPKTPLTWVALLRIMVGLMFLLTWLPNFLDGLYTPDGLLIFFIILIAIFMFWLAEKAEKKFHRPDISSEL